MGSVLDIKNSFAFLLKEKRKLIALILVLHSILLPILVLLLGEIDEPYLGFERFDYWLSYVATYYMYLQWLIAAYMLLPRKDIASQLLLMAMVFYQALMLVQLFFDGDSFFLHWLPELSIAVTILVGVYFIKKWASGFDSDHKTQKQQIIYDLNHIVIQPLCNLEVMADMMKDLNDKDRDEVLDKMKHESARIREYIRYISKTGLTDDYPNHHHQKSE